MLTKLTIRNFKRIKEAEILLDKSVVFIGPNNSGKTSALQALTLWDAGLKAWISKRGADTKVSKRPGVTINKKDMVSVAVPAANLLWNDLHTGETQRDKGKQKTTNILIEITVEGETGGQRWKIGLEFDYANPESFYCRPLRLDAEGKERMALPDSELVKKIRVALLPPMSGLSSIEAPLPEGRVNVLIGEGQTAQILRNLCYSLKDQDETLWEELQKQIEILFGIKILPPVFDEVRGEILMSYKERSGVELDLMCSGRGMQQTLLILSYLLARPQTVILLDEPDAHLEILRQQQIYQLINDIAHKQGCQIISASHSEVVLNQAVEKDTVIAFLGKKPHVLLDKKSQLLKSLAEIGFEDYYLAEEKGWVLYLEGSTDLEILREFAKLLSRQDALDALDAVFVHYLDHNQPSGARRHFHGLKEAKNDLLGVAIFDRLNKELNSEGGLHEAMWSKREIENYFCHEKTLVAWAKGQYEHDLISAAEAQRREEAMFETIQKFEESFQFAMGCSAWDEDVKASDEVLDKLLPNYFKKLDLPLQTLSKGRYYELVEYMDKEDVNEEVFRMLDLIVKIFNRTKNIVQDER